MSLSTSLPLVPNPGLYSQSQRRVDSARLLRGSNSIPRFLTLILLNPKAIRFSSKLYRSNALELLLYLSSFHSLYNYDCKIIVIAFILRSQDAKTHYRPGAGTDCTSTNASHNLSIIDIVLLLACRSRREREGIR